jgi:hypothetical protein
MSTIQSDTSRRSNACWTTQRSPCLCLHTEIFIHASLFSTLAQQPAPINRVVVLQGHASTRTGPDGRLALFPHAKRIGPPHLWAGAWSRTDGGRLRLRSSRAFELVPACTTPHAIAPCRQSLQEPAAPVEPDCHSMRTLTVWSKGPAAPARHRGIYRLEWSQWGRMIGRLSGPGDRDGNGVPLVFNLWLQRPGCV